MSIQDDKTRIKHMLDAAQKAIAFVNHRSFQDLENDERPCGGNLRKGTREC